MNIKNINQYLRYDWPVQFVLFITNWLPDNVIFLRFRGRLISPFLGACKGKLKIARNVLVQNPQKIFFSENVYVGYGACLLATDDIMIGNNVQIAPYCVIVSADHLRIDNSFTNDHMKPSPIVISDDCWLGSHVVVTAGSFLPKGSCVGAGAVFKGKHEESGLFVGVPAKQVKKY